MVDPAEDRSAVLKILTSGMLNESARCKAKMPLGPFAVNPIIGFRLFPNVICGFSLLCHGRSVDIERTDFFETVSSDSLRYLMPKFMAGTLSSNIVLSALHLEAQVRGVAPTIINCFSARYGGPKPGLMDRLSLSDALRCIQHSASTPLTRIVFEAAPEWLPRWSGTLNLGGPARRSLHLSSRKDCVQQCPG